MKYIDSHAFVWSNDYAKYPAISNDYILSSEKIEFSPPELLLRNGRPSGIEKYILIQAPQYFTDNTYIVEQVFRFPELFKAVVCVDTKSSNSKLIQEIDYYLKLGINAFRLIVNTDLENQYFQKNNLDLMFNEAEKKECIISIFADPNDLDQFKSFFQTYPKVPVVIENIGNIFNQKNNFQKSLDLLCEISSKKNVYLKISGFNSIANPKFTVESLLLSIESLSKAFSADRLMWGSDYPFQIVNETYEDSISIIKDECTFLSATQRNQILSETARDLFFNS